MELNELRDIIQRRDLAAADAARPHAQRHATDLASMYWRAGDWTEKSIIVGIMRDQTGAHLRGMMRDFLRAVPPDADWQHHFDTCKAASLASLKGDPSLFQVYTSDPGRLQRDIEAEVGPVEAAPASNPGPVTSSSASAASAMGRGDGGVAGNGGNGGMMIALAGCGCLLVLMLFAGAGYFLLASAPTPVVVSPVSPPTPVPTSTAPTPPQQPFLPTPTPPEVPPTPPPVVAPSPTVQPQTPSPVPSPTTAPSGDSGSLAGPWEQGTISGPPSVAIEHVTSGVLRTGAAIWLMDYTNRGQSPIARAQVVISMFDAAGQRVGEKPGFARHNVLNAGATTTIMVLEPDPPAGMARYEIHVRENSSTYMPAHADAVVTEHRFQPARLGRGTIVGTVQNPTGSPLRFTRVVVVGRNDEGLPVAFGDSFATDRELAPGASSGFSVRIGTFQLAPPSRWEVTASGRPPR